ncbi:keywimysin-related RiPP [Rhodococcus sp. 2G]
MSTYEKPMLIRVGSFFGETAGIRTHSFEFIGWRV